MRLELRDGMWAELRERIDHGADKRIKLARLSEEIADRLLVDDVLIREFVTAWNVLDPAGGAIALDDPAGIDRLPEDIADDIAIAAANLYVGATVPNPSTGS